jgi:tetratricopeptide (TPR) repeat protein
MARFALSLLAASFLVCITTSASETSSRPLRQTELLALVAGNALPENIVNEIRARGVAFRMDASFRAQLTTAGATPSVLAALGAAKAPAKDTAEDKSDPSLLQHIAAAAKLMKDKHYEEAADELTATLKGNFEKFEIGFVMGELLREQERWGEAAAVYTEVLRQDPNFPEAHTKLSYLMYRLGDPEQTLREARIALARTPENAEAHKNAGLALETLSKFDAAALEYKEALRIKPDYQVVHYDLGLLFYRQRDWDASITEYKKAILLKPADINAHYNLGVTFADKGDIDSAIREYREGKRLAPDRFDVRMNLSSALIGAGLYPQAIVELRELEIMAPDSAMCHRALGAALWGAADYTAAEGEYRKATVLDPSDPGMHLDLGAVLEIQNKQEAALQAYRDAEEVDNSSSRAHLNVGKVLLAMKRVNEAVKELKQAEDLAPGDASVHDYYGQALQFSGDLDAALGEFKESLSLNAKQANVRLELAGALEKKGDWAAALDQYRQAAIDDNVDFTTPRAATVRVYDAGKKYKEAQERFNEHLASLRKAGKSNEAARLEKSLRDTQSASGATQKLDSLMQSGSQAFSDRRFDDSDKDYKEALKIAEALHPLDARLPTIFAHLGHLAAFRGDFAGATGFFERQLKVAGELSGPQNAMAVTEPLKFLAMSTLSQHDFAAAKKFADRALDVNRKFYGENSLGYAEMLAVMAGIYLSQEDYEHAEPYLLQATDIEEKLYNYDPRYGGMETRMLMTLCMLYEKWDKPEKLEPYDRKLISLLEKEPGPDTSYLEQTLTREAKTLRTLGRPEEAGKIEQRLKSLQPTAASNPN